jgi:glutathione S-transferase
MKLLFSRNPDPRLVVAVATFLPHNQVAGLPLAEYPAVCRWYRELEQLDAWRDPFRALSAPELPPISGEPRPA